MSINRGRAGPGDNKGRISNASLSCVTKLKKIRPLAIRACDNAGDGQSSKRQYHCRFLSFE
jgi:hypothetical protein